jgi:YD repeat-containing protein
MLTEFTKHNLTLAMGYNRAVQRASNSYATALNYATAVSYHAAGTPSQFTYGNGLVQTIDVNDRSMPVAMKASSSSVTALDHSYDYDDNGNVASYLDNRVPRYSLNSLNYDGLDRLTSISGGAYIGSVSLGYDGLGNIKSYNTLNSNLTYNYDTSNRLASVSGSGAASKSYSSFTYDTRGNVANNSYRSFTYNLAGQMTTSGTYSYVYDAQNRRVKQVDSKGTSYSFYAKDGTLLYRETPSGGISYVYLNKKLIAKDGAGNTNGTAIAAPTAAMSCSPSTCETTKTGTGTASITVTLTSSCTNGCDIEWTGNSFFNNATGTFSFYCRGTSDSILGWVSAIVTDRATGLKKTESRYLMITCKSSGGGIEL